MPHDATPDAAHPATRATLADAVRVEGRGLFTGRPAAVDIIPAEAGGLVFDGGESGPFPLSVDRIDERPAHPAFAAMPARSTSLSAGPGSPPVHTVEHLLAALAGLGISDATIRVEGGEIPIGDGSANLFVEPILHAGRRELDSQTHPIVIREAFEVVDGRGGTVRVEPADAAEYVYKLDYGPAAPVPPGSASWNGSAAGSPDTFARDVAPARTFCLREEAEALHALGLFKDLTPRDMLVFGSEGPIDNTLRFPDEPARHKLLDLIGDLALVGRPILGRIVGVRSGHALNREAARRVAQQGRTIR